MRELDHFFFLQKKLLYHGNVLLKHFFYPEHMIGFVN